MIIIKDDIIPQELQDYYHMLVFGSTNVNAMLPLVCKYEPTAFEGDSMPISFEHVLKNVTFQGSSQTSCLQGNKHF